MDINTLALTSAADDGIWVDFTEGTRLKIRSTENRRYKQRVATLSRKEKPTALRKDPVVQQRVYTQAMADEILVDFEGFTDAGKPVANTPENRLRLCRIPEIRDFIAQECQDNENFRSEGLAADAADLKSED